MASILSSGRSSANVARTSSSRANRCLPFRISGSPVVRGRRSEPVTLKTVVLAAPEDSGSQGMSDAEAQQMIMAGGSIPDSKSPYAGGNTPVITDEEAKAGAGGSEELAAQQSGGRDLGEGAPGRDLPGIDMLPHTGRQAPMSEDKRSVIPQQGGAPEADKAVLGQLYQPGMAKAPGTDKETPEQRYGSKEAYEQAMEEHKDKSRRSEKQTGDDDARVYSEGSA